MFVIVILYIKDMKSRKSTQVKNPQVQKCSICLHEFIKDNVDMHMHSSIHHKVIETLLGRQQMHRCWACNLSLPGLKLYQSHIATSEHITKLFLLRAARYRGNGYIVDYNDKELIALCAKKKREIRYLKEKKKKQKIKKRKAKTATQSEKQRQKCRKKKKNRNKDKRPLDQEKPYTANSRLERMTMPYGQIHLQQPQSIAPQLCISPDGYSYHKMQKKYQSSATIQNSSVKPYVKSNQIESWQSSWQQSSISPSKVNQDFTSHHVSPFRGVLLGSEATSQLYNQQTETKVALQEGIQKRLWDMSFKSHFVKRHCLNRVSSASPKLNVPAGTSLDKRLGSGIGGQPTNFAKPSALFPTPMIFHKSLNEEKVISGFSEPSTCSSLKGVAQVDNATEKSRQNHERLLKTQSVKSNLARPIKSKPAVLSETPHVSERNQRQLHLQFKISSLKSQKVEEQLNKVGQNISPQNKPLNTPNHLTVLSADIQKESNGNSQSEVKPSSNKPILPSLLKQSVNKAAVCKPNLNLARGTQTVQKPVKVEDKSRALKTSVQKLISSNSSQCKVHWIQMYHEAKDKLQEEKRIPRFGIEMVSPFPPEPQESTAEDVNDVILDEGFHWESISLDAEIPSSSVDQLSGSQLPKGNMRPEDPNAEIIQDGGISRTDHISWPVQTVARNKELTMRNRDCEKDRGNNVSSKMQGTSKPQMGEVKCIKDEFTAGTGRNLSGPSVTHVTAPGTHSVNVICKKSDAFGTDRLNEKKSELNNIKQIKKEKQDVPDSVSQTAKPVKGQFGELLAASLREEKLNKSLEEVDGQLLQARIVLQAAFMEVQRLQEFRQKVTSEMTSLRTKRIEVLQGLHNSSETSHNSDAQPKTPNASAWLPALLLNPSSVQTAVCKGPSITAKHMRDTEPTTSMSPADVQNKPAASSYEAGSTCNTSYTYQTVVSCTSIASTNVQLTGLSPVLDSALATHHGLGTSSMPSLSQSSTNQPSASGLSRAGQQNALNHQTVKLEQVSDIPP